MESKCSACGFVNPEGAGFCSLCGVPFIGPVRGPAPSAQRLPNRVKGESAELDPESLHRRLDEDSSAMRTQEELLKELQRLVPDGKGDDDLDGLLSDYDGIAVKPMPGAPPAPPPAPTGVGRNSAAAQAASAARLAQALGPGSGVTRPAAPPEAAPPAKPPAQPQREPAPTQVPPQRAPLAVPPPQQRPAQPPASPANQPPRPAQPGLPRQGGGTAPAQPVKPVGAPSGHQIPMRPKPKPEE